MLLVVRVSLVDSRRFRPPALQSAGSLERRDERTGADHNCRNSVV